MDVIKEVQTTKYQNVFTKYHVYIQTTNSCTHTLAIHRLESTHTLYAAHKNYFLDFLAILGFSLHSSQYIYIYIYIYINDIDWSPF